MDRIAFSKKLALLGVCPLVIQKLSASEPSEITLSQDTKLQELQSQKQFVENWLADLLESMEKNLDRKTQEKLVGNCGVACFDIHCECTRNTHKTIFETALGKKFRVEIAESLRRGGKTCHFIVYLS